jgi:Icc-related predicted phosphoesterase
LKILAVGDFAESSRYDDFEKSRHSGIDLILSCGDVDPEYLDFLATVLCVPIYHVRGNHDRLKSDGFVPAGNIDGRVVVHNGTRIAGLEGSMWYGGRGVEYSEREMSWKVFLLTLKIRLKGGIDIVVAHAPPYGIGDLSDECHRGFKSLTRMISQVHPRYFLHAHVHPNYSYKLKRITQVGETKVVNCSGSYVFEV